MKNSFFNIITALQPLKMSKIVLVSVYSHPCFKFDLIAVKALGSDLSKNCFLFMASGY